MSYPLSNMTQSRCRHTQNDFLSCGDDQSSGENKCEVYIPETGKWSIEDYNLTESRFGHTSWSLNNGSVVLLGGWSASITTETIQGGGTLRGFDLKQERM